MSSTGSLWNRFTDAVIVVGAGIARLTDAEWQVLVSDHMLHKQEG